jgi:hypothetical protein
VTVEGAECGFQDLDPAGKLTAEQLKVVDIYIAKFKSTSVGQEAISDCRRRERRIHGY